jgi:glycosyltransferase involved in cell wall biosynthesis
VSTPLATRPGTGLLSTVEQRLQEAASALLGLLPAEPGADPGSVAARLLPLLVEHCRPPERADARWLLLTALSGAFPTTDEVTGLGRRLELSPTHAAVTDLLGRVLAGAVGGRIDLAMTVVHGGTVADVDFCARHETHTGIHRVVRETVRRWHATHDVTPAAWTEDSSAFRTLSPSETARILRYGDAAPDPADDSAWTARLVVPWRSVVVLADVPNGQVTEQLTAMARFSGNTLGLVGYDMIPITSAETRPAADAVTFAQYLTVVKHAHRVAGISRSATTEFAGFATAVRAQGLPGPRVGTVHLANEPPAELPEARPQTPHPRPVVLVPGSREPHKNQRAVLHAAERLWREGLDFELRMVGGAGWTDEVLRPAIRRLHADQRPLTELGRVSDARLTAELQGADVVVFVSLHEGYGLPVAEALACGTPVVTSDFGSQREIAEGGGCLVVDPRDDDQVTAALRRLVCGPEERARLRAEIAGRTVRTWDRYAEDLWGFLVEGEDDEA